MTEFVTLTRDILHNLLLQFESPVLFQITQETNSVTPENKVLSTWNSQCSPYKDIRSCETVRSLFTGYYHAWWSHKTAGQLPTFNQWDF